MFSSDHNNPDVFCSAWTGSITANEMLEAYQNFFKGPQWQKRSLEFADFSEADLSQIKVPDLQKLCNIVAKFYQENGVSHARCASWIPREINRSLLEIYDFLSKQSPEVTRVFPNKGTAMAWLCSADEKTAQEFELNKGVV
ncbi:MAG: hypothetical protein AAGB06_04380 [Verrucomicrobiota bacterium]